MNLNSFIIILIGVTLNAIGQLALKAGAKKIGYIDLHSDILLILKSAFNLPIFIGLFCYIASVALWVVALTRVPVSVAYPMLSIGYIIVSVLAFLLFNEVITLNKFLAMLVIIFGVYLLSQTWKKF